MTLTMGKMPHWTPKMESQNMSKTTSYAMYPHSIYTYIFIQISIPVGAICTIPGCICVKARVSMDTRSRIMAMVGSKQRRRMSRTTWRVNIENCGEKTVGNKRKLWENYGKTMG